jgi:hypothetical protein
MRGHRVSGLASRTEREQSALPPQADMCSALAHVRFGPLSDICNAAKHSLFDDLVGDAEQTR